MSWVLKMTVLRGLTRATLGAALAGGAAVAGLGLVLKTAARGAEFEPIPLVVYSAPAPDALAEVNAKRAARGLRPYAHDPALTEAAQKCAAYRAARLMFGHVTGGMGDFQFLAPGVRCSATGCAAYPDQYGWMSCAIYDNFTHAGAAWVRGADGKRYMHLFLR